jgi:hypothetical protein
VAPQPPSGARREPTVVRPDAAATGWLLFAATMIFLVGVFNLIDGAVALAEDDKFVVDELFFGDLAMWGIIALVNGVILVVTAWLIYRRNPIGAALGIAFAGLNMIWQLFFVGVYPIWSLLIIAIDALIIYALTVYGLPDPD